MDGFQYCSERVLVPGSRLYLTRHFIDAALVPKLVILEALFVEIASIPERVSEAAVAHNKLGWWQEEISRCWQNEGRHPISQAIQQHGINKIIAGTDLIGLLAAVSAWVDVSPINNFDELQAHCAAIGGAASKMEAQVCSTDSQLLESAGKFGAAHYLVAMTRDIGLDARAGRWYVPMDLEARYHPRSGSDPVGCGCKLNRYWIGRPLENTVAASPAPGDRNRSK
jgi:phytoene synthase